MRLLQELDTPAGHILVCLGVILLGAVFCALRIPKGEDLIVGGSSAVHGYAGGETNEWNRRVASAAPKHF